MSEPARKRRAVGPPQSQQPQTIHITPRSLTSETHVTAYGNQIGISPSTNSHTDFVIPGTVPADPFSTQFGGVPSLPLGDGVQAQFYSAGDICQRALLTTETGQWQNQGGVPEASLAAPAADYDINELSAFDTEDLWKGVSLYKVDGGVSFTAPTMVGAPNAWSRKRGFDEFRGAANESASETALPSLFASVPNIRSRGAHRRIPNPFLESAEDRYPTLANRVRPVIPKNGVIDGYIKTCMSTSEGNDTGEIHNALECFSPWRQNILISLDDGGPIGGGISLLPGNFPTGMKLDRIDEKLWSFHLNAYCPGRMLLPGNYWYHEVPAIAVKHACARHALLALSASYVLDYEPTEEMRMRANRHYSTAVKLLEDALNSETTYAIGQDDGVVAAMILIFCNEIVNWESRQPQGKEPLWRKGSRAAKLLLDRADPGYRYWKPENVQSSAARIGNANWVAYTEICAQAVAPLAEEHTANMFSWLLAGSEQDVHKIHGVTGVSPKLLHLCSQITYFAALLKKDPYSHTVLRAARTVRERLSKFSQWSDHSPGYLSGDKLMASCVLDNDGKLNNRFKVTDVSAYAWVPATEMYLHMRVYRKPRSHPHVQKSLKRLIQCVQMLPCTGPLFTSQSPFFAVFLMAIGSYKEEDREVARDWFGTVAGHGQCRSSVPPVWTAVQNLWTWLDNELKEEDYDEDLAIGDRRAWWEDMVNEFVEKNGVLSLV
ncbi:fungal-specific transcription factor domain-containing protein [Chaetomium sp. MPI-SDFR-AT-0129]|nr:fungal-specific transcription factor domain-containing protein [Chaetomium sp. MPI-SDFR-AT-0129]